MTINWFAIIYILAAILSWPITTYIWARKIKYWKASRSIGVAVSAGFLSVIAVFILTDFLRLRLSAESASLIGLLFPLIWMGIPILALLVLYVFSRGKDRKVKPQCSSADT